MFDSGSGQTHLIDLISAAVLSAIEAGLAERSELIALAVHESGINDAELWLDRLDLALDWLTNASLIEPESTTL
ncbi:MAG: hypothetical protein K2Y02_05205 [Burkholderiaceae bacterium]|nr:hypothetical protein [Burkholderiaceae bacterium]